MKRNKIKSKGTVSDSVPAARYLIETVVGIEQIVRQEIERRYPQVAIINQSRGEIEVDTPTPDLLLNLKTAQAVYAVERFDISRPRALLGDQHFRRLTQRIMQVIKASDHPFQSLYIAAAGSDTPVMQRLKQELSAATSLIASEGSGDLWLRIRPTAERTGWETLIRLTPRPLATRAWRVQDMEGALNATVAQAMIQLGQPQPSERILNIACGSGTLMIEGAHASQEQLIGFDIDPNALALAQANFRTSGLTTLSLVFADAQQMPFAAQSFEVLLADLPFGQRVGSHADNLTLYPVLLMEAARVAVRNARFAAITHELKLMDRVLKQQSNWTVTERLQITLRGLHPCIYLLRRR